MTRPSTVTPARRVVALLTALLVLAGVGVSAGAPAAAASPPPSAAVSAGSMSALLEKALATPESPAPIGPPAPPASPEPTDAPAPPASPEPTAPTASPEPAEVAALSAEPPLTLTDYTLDNVCFSPDGDGEDDVYGGDLVFDRPADVVVTVTPYRTDDVLRTITGRTSDGNRYTLQWDGKDSAGAVLPDAPYYRVRITATAVGGTATWDDWYWFACVDNARRVGTITGPAPATVLGAGSTMTVELTGVDRARDIDSVVIEDVATGKVLGSNDSIYEKTVEVEVQPGVLADGEHQLRARVGFWDLWGTERSFVVLAGT